MLITNESKKRRDVLWVSLWLNSQSNNGFNLFQFIFHFMSYLSGEHNEEKCWTYRQKHNSIRQLNQTTNKNTIIGFWQKYSSSDTSSGLHIQTHLGQHPMPSLFSNQRQYISFKVFLNTIHKLEICPQFSHKSIL